MTCDQATNTTGPILSKQVKAYAITTKSRLPSLAVTASFSREMHGVALAA
jgi:hypothetical protein